MCVFLALMGMLFSQDSNYFFPIYANEYVALFCYEYFTKKMTPFHSFDDVITLV